jgi:cell division septation protein DedD
MVVDYCERKQVNRNKPRQRSGGLYLLGLLAIVGIAYGLGFGSAWYFYRPARQAGVVTKASPAAPAKKAPEAAVPAAPPAAVTPPKGSDIPLTFYETLPKGSKSLIGTGLNPAKEKVPHGARPAAKDAKPAPLSKSDKVTPPPDSRDSGTDATQGNPSQDKEPIRKSHDAFLVQVASTKERKEADDLVGKLVGKGIAAYLLESKVEGKGTWYRVRVGKHLSRQDAEAIAARLGKGALIIPE